jgi:hypothetical protein
VWGGLEQKNVAFKAAKADKQDEKEKPSSSASRRDVGANIGSSRQDVKRTVHKKLRIVSGRFGSRRLLSPDDQNVRPMMEKVRRRLEHPAELAVRHRGLP